MKVKYIVIPLLVLLVGFLVYNKFFSPKARKAKAAENTGAKKGGPIPVSVIVVKDTLFSTGIDITGTVDANEQTELVSQVAGNITGIFFKEGSKVTKDQLLVKVYDKDIQAQLKQLQFQIKLAEEQESRSRILLEKEAVSKSEYDVALAGVNTLKAQADMISAQLSKLEIRAPFSGTIGIRKVSPGSYLSPQTAIATLVNIDPAKLTFSVPERYLSLIKTGSKVNFTVESSRETYTGTVYVIEPGIDPSSRTIAVRATVPNPKGVLKAGSFAKVSLQLEQIPKTILVPTEAVVPDLKSSKVYVARNGKATEVMVKTDMRTDSVVQVVSGLKNGDSVVVSGIIQMRANVPLKIVKVIK